MEDDEVFEEDAPAEVSESEEEEESSLVEDDEISAEEEGFLRGYREATASKSRKQEAEEEELE